MPQYVDLVRRAVKASEHASSLRRDSRLIRDLAQRLRDAHNGEVVLRRCSWCERYEVGGEWLHLEAIGAGQFRITTSLRERATNGICDDCLRRELRQSTETRADRRG